MLFLVILITLTVILYYSKGYKEGFIDFPVKHNNYVKDSQTKFNEMTNTINLYEPVIAVDGNSAAEVNKAIGGLNAESTSKSYNLEYKNNFNIPDKLPNTFIQTSICESKSQTCDAFNDPKFAENCGMSFDKNAIGSSGKPHAGGMFISKADRKSQIDAAENVKSTGSAPYDPYKVFKPTLGTTKPGTFALTKDQCVVVKEKVDCESKQTFGSPNCAQCFTSQTFSRVDPNAQKLPSSIYLFGNGKGFVKTSESAEKNLIAKDNIILSPTNATVINIPANAEGNYFTISIDSPDGSTTPYVSGYLEGKTPRGSFKIDIINLVQKDVKTNLKPRINGSVGINGFRALAMIPGNNQTSIDLLCLLPFSFLNIYDTDALTCDNGPIITQEASATFLESDPCFGKQNQPGNYKLECLQSRWVSVGGTQKGTGYPSTKEKANAIQLDSAGNPLSIDVIVDNLNNKMKQAVSGLDSNGNKLSINDWNTVSMWGTGVPINTPCDGPNRDTGPLSQDCLSYLYYNKGITSHIGSTYTLQQSQVASMKGQNIANTYCQPGAPLDPETPEGLEFGQKLGGVANVKKTYDEINRLANDNTTSNDKRSSAIKQCYGIQLESIAKKVSTDTCLGECDTILYSKNGKFSLNTQSDGNLVLYDKNSKILWASGSDTPTPNPPYVAYVQSDGNFVLYDGKQTPVWESNSKGNGVPPYRLTLENEGVLVLYDSTNKIIWTSTVRYNNTMGGYLETTGPQPRCFRNLSLEQAMEECISLGNKCKGFSYSNTGDGTGCFKGNVNAGFRTNNQYNGYVKMEEICPDNMYLYAESEGGFCCPVAPQNYIDGEFKKCPVPEKDGKTMCSMGPLTQGLRRCY
jgi:hypothetical protein